MVLVLFGFLEKFYKISLPKISKLKNSTKLRSGPLTAHVPYFLTPSPLLQSFSVSISTLCRVLQSSNNWRGNPQETIVHFPSQFLTLFLSCFLDTTTQPPKTREQPIWSFDLQWRVQFSLSDYYRRGNSVSPSFCICAPLNLQLCCPKLSH